MIALFGVISFFGIIYLSIVISKNMLKNINNKKKY